MQVTPIDSTLARLIYHQLRLVLDWTEVIKRSFLHSSTDLPGFPPQRRVELCQGIIQQVKVLREILSDFSAETHADQQQTQLTEETLFARLCDAYSFYTGNHEIENLFGYLWMVTNGEDYARLHDYLRGSTLVLHITCQQRLAKAEKSRQSFAPDDPDEMHLYVMGQEGNKRPGFSFLFDNGKIILSVGDSYESHYIKTLYTYALVSLLFDVQFILKLDDDVSLGSRQALRHSLQHFRRTGIDYAGWMARSSVNCIYRGWHVGKCSDARFEMRGLCTPASSKFAMGGFGYILSNKALSILRDHFLGIPSLSHLRQPYVEDQLVGLIMDRSDISDLDMLPERLGVYVEGMEQDGYHQDSQSDREFHKRLIRLLPYNRYW